MRIVNLVENTEGSKGCLCEHGLSFYVETKKHKLLVDTGATGVFAQNAKKLSVDLHQVDTVILSHGHYDHAGGILTFAGQNQKALIWMQRCACDAFYHKSDVMEKYIGIDQGIRELKTVRFAEGNQRIDDEIFLFSGVTGRRLWPLGNLELKVKRGDSFYQDDFMHEQYLVLEEDGKKVLLSGCAHNGILNILDRFREIYTADPDVVISGFHMRKKSGYTQQDLSMIRETGMELKKYNTEFYTGHCTGELPYQILKEVMGNRLSYLHSGDEILIR